MESLQNLVETRQLTPDEIAAKTSDIYKAVLVCSPCFNTGNFQSIHPDDLRRLFDFYDTGFFEKQCRATLGEMPISFRLSRRMTSAAGQTARMTHRTCGHQSFEISVSTTLLFQTFQEGDREIKVNGLVCHDRLEALQRIFEHELVHLIEMLLWTDSSCKGDRFRSIACRLFGHQEHAHQLITPRERALMEFGIRPGHRVRFTFEGNEYVGKVNRITKRATVLVEDSEGERYMDGKHYKKFYVPVGMLERDQDS